MSKENSIRRSEPVTQCIFCGQENPTSEEHVLADWAYRLMDEYKLPYSRIGTFTAHNANGEVLNFVELESKETTSPVLCHKCNHDWGGKLQGNASKVLKSFIIGDWYKPNITELNTIVRWYVSDLMVSEFIHNNHETYSQETRQLFKTKGFLPKNLSIWIGSLKSPDFDANHRALKIFFDGNQLPEKGNAHIRSLAVGHIVFISTGLPDQSHTGTGVRNYHEIQTLLKNFGFIQIKHFDRKFKSNFPTRRSIVEPYAGVKGFCKIISHFLKNDFNVNQRIGLTVDNE